MIPEPHHYVASEPLAPGEVSLVRHPRELDVELMHAVLAPSQRYAEMRENPVVIRIESDGGTCQCRGTLRKLVAGDLHVCRPWTTCSLVAGPDGLRLSVLSAQPRQVSVVSEPRTTDLAAALLDTVEAWGAGDADRRDQALDRFREALGDPRGHWTETSPPIEPGTVRRARAHLEEHPSSAVPLDELAEVTGLSKFHLARSFRAYHGVPPHLFWIHRRIARARTLLAAGEASATVAAHLGFADPSHFGRRFRQIVGVSPVAYARATVAPIRGRLA